MIALYNIAPETRFPHVNGFFSKDLSEVVEDKSGWIFMRGGDVGVYRMPAAPAVFVEADRGRRPKAFQSLFEERFRGAGGGRDPSFPI